MKLKAFLFFELGKIPHSVTPAKAGPAEGGMDSGLRLSACNAQAGRNDMKRPLSTSCGIVIFGFFLCWSLLVSPFVFAQKTDRSESAVPVFGYKIIKVFPHDPQAFTQGLVFHKGVLYEGTGLL